MAESEQARYFKIGVFVLVGLVLLVVLVLFFAGSHLLTGKVDFETYFNETVQGLSVGSPVKYRGIKIGKVKKITFAANAYNIKNNNSPAARYVYVLFTIDPDYLEHVDSDRLRPFIKQEVKAGLRTKMALQDLTGNAYLEINFTDPDQNPVLPIKWTPKHIYIPSTTSVLARFTDSIQAILNGLKKVNFPQFFSNIQNVAQTTSATMKNMDNILTQSRTSIIDTSRNMRALTNNLKQLTSTLEQNPSSILFDKPKKVDPSQL